MDKRRMEQFVRDRSADLEHVAHVVGGSFRLPIWVNFDHADGKWEYCCAKYGGPGATVYEKSQELHVTGKRLAGEHDGMAVFFAPDQGRGPALGLCFDKNGAFVAFQAGHDEGELHILSARLEDLKPVLARIGALLAENAPALAGAKNPVADLAPVLDEALSMAGVSGTRASILADAVKGAVERAVRAPASNSLAAGAADTACSVFVATTIAHRTLEEELFALEDELKASKQADKRYAALLKDHEKLKLASEGFRKRAERHSLDIVDLQKKLKSASAVVPVMAPVDLSERLAALYGISAT